MKALIPALLCLGIFGCELPLNCDADSVWRDTANELCWQRTPSSDSMCQQEAIDYCRSLKLGGESDWRLPSIGQLRSLIQGCAGNERGGSCEIDGDDKSGECPECEAREGPGEDGCYWNTALDGSCSTQYWSLTDSWCVDFSVGGILDLGWDYGPDSDEPGWEVQICGPRARCVRD